MKVVKFMVVGGGVTSLGYFIYIALISLGVSYQVSLLVDYAFGVVVGYILNRYWTFSFNHNNHKVGLGFLKYVSTYVAMFFVNVILLMILVEAFGWDPWYSQLMALIFLAILSYWVQNFWVFGAG